MGGIVSSVANTVGGKGGIVDMFYLHPLHVGFLLLGLYVPLAVCLLRKGAIDVRRAALATGLKPVPLDGFLRYINGSEDAGAARYLDGSKAAMPVIEGIVSGSYNGFSVSLFLFGLPTGRTGTWQTVTHVRSYTETLPVLSISDETYSPALSQLLKDSSGANTFHFRDGLFQSTGNDMAGNKKVIGSLKSIKNLVVDAVGHDLFFYVRGKIAEPTEYEHYVRRGLSLFEMIKSGRVDLSLIRESEAEKAYALYICAKYILLVAPALVAMLLVGYGNIILSAVVAGGGVLFYCFARARYRKYRNAYP